jgi:hypothetical protein
MTLPQHNEDRYSRPCAGISRFFAIAKFMKTPEQVRGFWPFIIFLPLTKHVIAIEVENLINN